MRKPILIMLLAVVSSNAVAEPVTYKCINSKGAPLADLVVDTNNMAMEWGNMKFTILAIDEFYIAAIRAVGGNVVGGEAFVQNRYTGDYLYTGVYGGRDDTESMLKKYPGKLAADTASGRCVKPHP